MRYKICHVKICISYAFNISYNKKTYMYFRLHEKTMASPVRCKLHIFLDMFLFCIEIFFNKNKMVCHICFHLTNLPHFQIIRTCQHFLRIRLANHDRHPYVRKRKNCYILPGAYVSFMIVSNLYCLI